MSTSNVDDVFTSAYQREVARYWNTNTNDPVNLELGKIDDIYHHHYGLGEPDLSVLDSPDDVRDKSILTELHRLETAHRRTSCSTAWARLPRTTTSSMPGVGEVARP